MESLDPKWIRVSSILAMIPALGADGKWGHPLNDIDPDVLQRKADLGSSVHAAIAAYCKDEFFVLDKTEEGFMDSFHKWCREVHLAFLSVEQRLYYEPMSLTGCIDMIGAFGGTDNWQIIDYKCTATPDLKKWALQAAFYFFLCEVNKIKVDNRVLFVQLDRIGKMPKVYEFEIKKELINTAMAMYNAYIYLTRK